MNTKKHRALLVGRLIHEYRISSQEAMLSLLAEHGIHCTQATLSRHLRELGISRHATPDGPVYQEDREQTWLSAMRGVVATEVTSVRHNGCLVVLRTLPGRASGVAAFLDRLEDMPILGTVAGDDTLFVAPADPSGIEALTQRISDEITQENT